MSVTSAIRKLISQGFSVEQALVAADAFEAEMAPQEPIRTARQERNKRYYDSKKASEKHLNSDVQDVSDADSPSLDKEIPPTPPKEIKPTPLPPVVSAREQFAEFWKLFPNKVGKRDAERELGFALQRSSFEEIIAGLRRYVAKTDDRPWCNPSTFLHQNRWDDEPAEPQRRQHSQGPPPSKGVVGAAQRMMEKSNGSESIFGSSGNGKLISAEPSDEPGRSAEYLQGGLSRRYVPSNH